LKVASGGWVHITRISILHLGYGPIYPQLPPLAIFLAFLPGVPRQNAIWVQKGLAFDVGSSFGGVCLAKTSSGGKRPDLSRPYVLNFRACD
jgi:hypothetical protein